MLADTAHSGGSMHFQIAIWEEATVFVETVTRETEIYGRFLVYKEWPRSSIIDLAAVWYFPFMQPPQQVSLQSIVLKTSATTSASDGHEEMRNVPRRWSMRARICFTYQWWLGKCSHRILEGPLPPPPYRLRRRQFGNFHSRNFKSIYTSKPITIIVWLWCLYIHKDCSLDTAWRKLYRKKAVQYSSRNGTAGAGDGLADFYTIRLVLISRCVVGTTFSRIN